MTSTKDSTSHGEVAKTSWQGKTVVAGAGLVALSALLAWTHSPGEDEGLSASEITDVDMAQAFAEAEAEGIASGALLLDLVEPADGEGGSEAQIAAFVGDLDAAAATDADFAGFYA